MCMCGGIIEAGLIAAAVGYIGKKIHKCSCKCHQPKECEHCHNIKKYNMEGLQLGWSEPKKSFEKEKSHNRYSFIQKLFVILAIIGFVAVGVGFAIEHFEHEHTINCEHKGN